MIRVVVGLVLSCTATAIAFIATVGSALRFFSVPGAPATNTIVTMIMLAAALIVFALLVGVKRPRGRWRHP